MFVAWHPIYAHPLPEGHRFPMLKYDLIPQQLLHEGIIHSSEIHRPQAIERDILDLTHDTQYLNSLFDLSIDAKAMRKIGFPLSKELVERECIITQGTIDCAEYALTNGAALNVAGGTHHAYIDRGEGFCIFNDFAVTCNYLLHKKRIKSALIIDLDVHQGNGTACLFQGKEEVFTFSMHGKNNYPYRKELSDWDIELPDGIGDEEYLEILSNALHTLNERPKPDLICYVSGVDVLSTDKLGKLGLSLEACKERDRKVIEFARTQDIPLIVSMGGGYSPDIKVIVDAHCTTFKLVKEYYF